MSDNFKEEYDLLIAMLSAFKQLGGDAIKRSLPAWKCMSDECVSFSEMQIESDKILFDFICDLTKEDSTIRIEETEYAFHQGTLLIRYCLIKGYDKYAVTLGKYIYHKAKSKGYTKIMEELMCELKYTIYRKEGETEDMNEFDNNIILNDENGNNAEFEFLDLIVYEEEEYVVLLPVEESDEAGEVVILKLEETENDDEESYVSVEDDNTLMEVFNIFKDKFKDEFNFVD